MDHFIFRFKHLEKNITLLRTACQSIVVSWVHLKCGHIFLKCVVFKVDFEYAPTYVDGEPNYVMQAVFASRKYAKEKAVPAEDVRNNQGWPFFHCLSWMNLRLKTFLDEPEELIEKNLSL